MVVVATNVEAMERVERALGAAGLLVEGRMEVELAGQGRAAVFRGS